MRGVWGSSNVDSAGYDERNQIMVVQFRNGQQYRWDGVSQWSFEQLMSAPSPGRALKEIEREYGRGSRIG